MRYIYFRHQSDEVCMVVTCAIRKPDGTVMLWGDDDSEWTLKPGDQADLAWAQVTAGTTGAA